MRKDFFRIDAGGFTKCFHAFPDIASVERSARFGHENTAGTDFLRLCIFFQHFAQLLRQHDYTHLAFQVDGSLSAPQGLDIDKAQLGHANAGGTDGLHEQIQLSVSGGFGCAKQAFVFCFGQLFFFAQEDAALDFQGFYFESAGFAEIKKAV